MKDKPQNLLPEIKHHHSSSQAASQHHYKEYLLRPC
jgi:hypothetical protein